MAKKHNINTEFVFGNYETFYAEAIENSGNMRLTIPLRLVRAAGIKKGDQFKVLIKKVINNENKNKQQTDIN